MLLDVMNEKFEIEFNHKPKAYQDPSLKDIHEILNDFTIVPLVGGSDHGVTEPFLQLGAAHSRRRLLI
ncbi:MAG: hypothetical protein AB8F95_01315 [Bacteroidia bacterium]